MTSAVNSVLMSARLSKPSALIARSTACRSGARQRGHRRRLSQRSPAPQSVAATGRRQDRQCREARSPPATSPVLRGARTGPCPTFCVVPLSRFEDNGPIPVRRRTPSDARGSSILPPSGGVARPACTASQKVAQLPCVYTPRSGRIQGGPDREASGTDRSSIRPNRANTMVGVGRWRSRPQAPGSDRSRLLPYCVVTVVRSQLVSSARTPSP
jgi:hypothetical protein